MSKLSSMKFMRGSTAMAEHDQAKKTKNQDEQLSTSNNNNNSIFDQDEDDTPRFVQLNSASSKDSSRLYTEQIGKDMNVGQENSYADMSKSNRVDEQRKIASARRTFGGFQSGKKK